MIIVAFSSFAILSVSIAPLIYCSVTSVPLQSITFARPFKTSSPSPPIISAGNLGVENPPSNSGHTVFALLSSINL